MATDVRGSTVVEANDWPPMAAQSACEDDRRLARLGLAGNDGDASRPGEVRDALIGKRVRGVETEDVDEGLPTGDGSSVGLPVGGAGLQGLEGLEMGAAYPGRGLEVRIGRRTVVRTVINTTLPSGVMPRPAIPGLAPANVAT